VIAAQCLTRRFGARTAVDDVSFEVASGEIVALLGPNGAGKTTTLRMLAGLVSPSSGGVMLDGRALTASTASSLRRRIGFLTEAPGLWDRLTVRENLTVYADLYGVPDGSARVDRLLGDLGLHGRGGTRAAELSKGMRQKVAIARTLLHDPDILLDEPTSGLDPEVSKSVREILRGLRARGCAILISTHNLYEAEHHADRIAVLHTRLLAVDTPARLRRKLATGRLVVHVEGQASRWSDLVASLGLVVEARDDALVVALRKGGVQTPELVRVLAAAGAAITEVRTELPNMEDIYLYLVRDRSEPSESVGSR
jgi:ABC-2 type transport system ATP-binding protein